MKWHQVTWYSRLVAIILFFGVIPALSFCVGVGYQKYMESRYPVTYMTTTWDSQLNKEYLFEFKYPKGWKVGQNSNMGSTVFEKVDDNFRMIDIEVFENKEKMDVREFLNWKGSPREYKAFDIVSENEALISYDSHGSTITTINFTHEDLFFNIDFHELGLSEIHTVLSTFKFYNREMFVTKLDSPELPMVSKQWPVNSEMVFNSTTHLYKDNSLNFEVRYPSTSTALMKDSKIYPFPELEVPDYSFQIDETEFLVAVSSSSREQIAARYEWTKSFPTEPPKNHEGMYVICNRGQADTNFIFAWCAGEGGTLYYYYATSTQFDIFISDDPKNLRLNEDIFVTFK